MTTKSDAVHPSALPHCDLLRFQQCCYLRESFNPAAALLFHVLLYLLSIYDHACALPSLRRSRKTSFRKAADCTSYTHIPKSQNTGQAVIQRLPWVYQAQQET